MAGELGLPSVASAQVDLPSVGRYNVFLNPLFSDTLYKKDSAGVVTSAVNALADPMSAIGDVIIRNAANVTDRLGIGSAGDVFTVAGGVPTWAAPAAVPVSLTATQVGFGSGANVLTGSAGFLYDDTTKTLTLGVGSTTDGSIVLKTSSNAFTTTIKTGVTGASYTLTLPTTDGAASEFLQTNGTGVLSWATPGGVTTWGGGTTGLTPAAATTGSITLAGTLVAANGGTGVNIESASLPLGKASTAAGKIDFFNASNAFKTTIQSGVSGADITWTLPTAQGGASTFLQNNGSGVLSWASASSGLTVGVSSITGGTTGSIGMNIGGIYSESISYRAQQATPFLTSFGYNNAIAGTFSGTYNTFYGYSVGSTITTGAKNTFIGADIASNQTTSDGNVFIGYRISAQGGGQNTECVAIGNQKNINGLTGLVAVGHSAGDVCLTSYGTFLGYYAGSGLSGSGSKTIGIGFYAGAYPFQSSAYSNSIALGTAAGNTANNQLVIGGNATYGGWGAGIYNVYIGNGVTDVSPAGVTINATGGSGANNPGGSLTLAGGKGAGSGVGGSLIFQTSVVGASGTTLQTLATAMTINNSQRVGVGITSPTSTFHSGGSYARFVRSISALRTLDATDDIIEVTANTFTITLPTAASITGREYIIKNNGAGVITIACNGAETIDGSATVVLGVQYGTITLVSNGTNWMVIC